MNNLYVDYRPLDRGASLSWDMARHIFTRHSVGLMVVAADNPAALLASVKKQWQRVVRQVQHERSSTLNPDRIMEFGRTLSVIQTLRFSAFYSDSPLPRHIVFATPAELAAMPQACHTLYVACEMSDEQLTAATSIMPERSVIATYFVPDTAPD